MIDLIGYVYSILFAGCYIPQIVKLYKTHETEGISISMYWACVTAYLLALVYTILRVGFDKIFFLNYGSGALFCSITMVLYYKYRKEAKKS